VSPEAITLMIDAFKSAGFNSDQLCLTYVNRCPIRRKFENQEVLGNKPFLDILAQEFVKLGFYEITEVTDMDTTLRITR